MGRGPTVAVVLLVASAAQLADDARAGWRIDRARTIAETVWHKPCGGRVALRWQILDDDYAETNHAALATAEDCVITFHSVQVTFWESFCTAMLHEYGHLAGYRDPANPADPLHSRNPMSVMHHAAFSDLRCRNRGRPFLARVGLLRPQR